MLDGCNVDEGAVRAHGKTRNLLDWLLSPLDEENGLVSNGVASIHISQEQGKKKRMKKKERDCRMQQTDKSVRDTKHLCF